MTDEVIRVKLIPEDVDGKAIARALFGLAVFATTIALSIYLQRALSGPDVFRAAKMRCYRLVGNTADEAGRACLRVAAKADSAYLSTGY
jgi:hypothetical protein